MKRIILICGFIAGAIASSVIAVSAAYCHTDQYMQYGMYIGYGSMLIAFSLIFIGTKNYRDKQNNGVISFGQAFKIGILIALIASTMYVIVWGIEYHFVFPDFTEKYAALIVEKAKKDGATQAEINKQIAMGNQIKEWYKNPLLFAGLTYAEILPVGILVTLISSLILKRKKNNIAVV